jgi:hypothetical protein
LHHDPHHLGDNAVSVFFWWRTDRLDGGKFDQSSLPFWFQYLINQSLDILPLRLPLLHQLSNSVFGKWCQMTLTTRSPSLRGSMGSNSTLMSLPNWRHGYGKSHQTKRGPTGRGPLERSRNVRARLSTSTFVEMNVRNNRYNVTCRQITQTGKNGPNVVCVVAADRQHARY